MLAGKGVTPVAAAGTRYYARPGLTFRPFSDAPRIEYAFIWQSDHETARLRAFVNLALEQVRGMGGPGSALDALWAADSG